ncbi:hypothetical protein D5278_21335 [bacterium 1XD21-13]|nr:hypothetical protein [bacterium 1XD21-13]
MKVKCIQKEKEYVRTIEGMGEGLVLFKTGVVNKRVGQNYHLFYEDKRKPPLDIAINPDSGTVEYVSYFAQDEKLDVYNIINDIEFKDGLVTIEDDFFDEKNTSISLEKKFKIVKSDTSIFILYKEVPNKILQAYKIDGFNYLLFSDDFEFYGVLLKNISDKELKEIQNSKCL